MASNVDQLLAERRQSRGGVRPGLSGLPGAPGRVDIDEQLRARRRQREVRDIELGAGVGQSNLGPSGASVGTRFQIGLMDTFDEKRNRFLQLFPGGDFRRIERESAAGGTEKVILFRRNVDEPFAKFDADLFEKFELMADVADIAGDAPAITGEALVALVTRGGGLVKRAAQMFAGGAGGEEVKQAFQSVAGLQRETIGEQQQRAFAQGTLAAAGVPLEALVRGPLNIIRGAAVSGIKPGAQRAQLAAARLDVPRMLPSQLTDIPLLRKLAGQAGSVLPTVGRYLQRQEQALVRSMLRLRDKDQTRFLGAELLTIHDEARGQIIAAARANPVQMSQGGSALQQGIAEYDDLATATVNRLYQGAREIETPEFDTQIARDVAEEVATGVQGRLQQQPATEASEEAAEQTIRLSELDGQLAAVIRDLLALDADLPAVTVGDRTFTATDQLRALRSRLWDLKTPNPGEIARAPQRDAAKLYGALNQVLKDPKNTDEAFRGAWDLANQEAFNRFSTMEKLLVVRASRSETPTQLARNLARPGQVDNLRLLQEIIPEGRWREFQQAAKADFVAPQNVDSLTTRLRGFDDETLRSLFSEADIGALRNVGENIDRLNALNVPEILQRQARDARVLEELVLRKDTARIDQLFEVAKSAPDLMRSLRAGLVEAGVERAITRTGAEQTLNRQALSAFIKELRDSGASKFLTRADKRVLRSVDTIAEFLPQTADTGASIQAGAAVAGARELSASAFITLLEHMGTGRFLTSKAAERIFVGTGKPKLEVFRSLTVLNAALLQAATDIEGQE